MERFARKNEIYFVCNQSSIRADTMDSLLEAVDEIKTSITDSQYMRIMTAMNSVYNQPETDWKEISEHKGLPESFIRKFKDKVDWKQISERQKLSEPFIREFQDRLDWEKVPTWQDLSVSFLKEFKDKISWMATWDIERMHPVAFLIKKERAIIESYLEDFLDEAYEDHVEKGGTTPYDVFREEVICSEMNFRAQHRKEL